MSNIVIADDIRQMDTARLRAELAKGLTATADVLTRLGSIWQELERRGEDLSDLRTGFARTISLIASGRLSAEAAVAFSGRPLILRKIEGMPLDKQRQLAAGEPVQIYLPGKTSPATLPLIQVPAAALGRVISDGTIRTPDEQKMAIRIKRKPASEVPRNYAITVDRESRTIKIGKMVVPIATIIAAMAEASGDRGLVIDSVERPARTVAGKVTDNEKERLKAAAKAHNMDESEMVRQAVVSMWML